MESEISNIITSYISRVFEIVNERYDIPISILNSIYKEVHQSRISSSDNNSLVATTKKSTSTTSPGSEYSETYLKKCTKDELIRLCKIKKVKTTGNKDDLVQRLIVSNKPSVVSKIFKCSPIHIAKNEFGNRIHLPTKLVFSDDKIAVGIQNDDGSISDLTADLIDICNQFKFRYKLPMNLDLQQKTADLDQKLALLIDDEKKTHGQD